MLPRRNVTTTEAGKPVPTFYSVRVMMAQMLVVMLVAFSMFWLPLSESSVLLVVLYGVLLLAERRMSIRSPQTLGIFLLSTSLLLLERTVGLGVYEIYMPAAYFGMLFLIGMVCMVRGHPLSLYYSYGNGLLPLHWWTSGVWVSIYAVGLTVGLLLPLNPGLFLLVPALPVAGAVLTLWLQLVSMGPLWRRPKTMHLGAFRFEEVPPHPAALKPFYTHFVREATHTMRQAEEMQGLSLEQMVEAKMQSDAPVWPGTRFFAAYEGEEMVGTVSCGLKSSKVALGVETTVHDPLSLDQLQQYGGIVEIGRFSICSRHRLQRELIQGLFRCSIEFALERDIAFLVIQAFPPVVSIYSKIGFQKISGEMIRQRGVGTRVMLMVYNLAKVAVCGLQDAREDFRRDTTKSYFGERYFKRQSLLSLFRSKPAWAIPDNALSQLCRSESAAGAERSVTT